jgi:GNAT superfamily N-acetyltransferase
MNIEYQIATNLTFNHIIKKIEGFTFPPIRKKIRTIRLHEPFTGVWATLDNHLLGAVLAETNHNGKSELFSLFVTPNLRNRGIATQLISLLVSTLEKNGVKTLQTRYWTSWKSLPAIEKLLKNTGWEDPELLRVIAEINIDKYNVVPWPNLKIPSYCEFFEWNNLTSTDRKLIDRLLQAQKIPGEFNPYQHSAKIFLPASIGLRIKGELAGWNIAYQLAPDKIEYNNLFVRDEYQRTGHAIALLYRSFGEQHKLNIPLATWVLNADNPAAMKIGMRIAGNHLNKLVEVKKSTKELG